MHDRKSVDILWVMDQLINSFRPFALANEVDLRFESDEKEVTISYLPKELLNDLFFLIIQMIPCSLAGHSILVKAGLGRQGKDSILKVLLENTCIGIPDFKVSNNCHPLFRRLPNGGICYEWNVRVDAPTNEEKGVTGDTIDEYSFSLPIFYEEFRKHLQFHFSKAGNLVELLQRQNAKGTFFLQQVNTCILSNISDVRFDANRLSLLLHMSRIQLYRKLKPLIKQSPANYIRSLRLQKAKELLETTDLRVSEVAIQTGFESPSHFTHVFIRNYGVRPSLFSRRSRNVTNE